MRIFCNRVRRTLVPLAAAAGLLGCTSGSEAVPIPGADHVVTAPVASADLPPVTEPPATDTTLAEQPVATVPPPEEPIATTATVATEPPTPSTSAPPPPETNAAPPVTDATTDDVYLRIGDEGPEVGLMQFKLSVLEYLPTGSDTGVFDDATQRGLRRFQGDYGLGADGIFGPLTGRALNAAVQSVNVEG